MDVAFRISNAGKKKRRYQNRIEVVLWSGRNKHLIVMAVAISATPSVSAVGSSTCSSVGSSRSDLYASRRDQALFGSGLNGSVVAKKQGRGSIRAYTGVAEPSTVRMGGNRTLYDLLGISKHVSLKEIKTAYREKARQYHPDVNPPSEEGECLQKFLEVQKAYGVLVNPDSRAQYDYTIRYDSLPMLALRYGISSSAMENLSRERQWGSQIVLTADGLKDMSAVKMPTYGSESGEKRFRCSYEMAC